MSAPTDLNSQIALRKGWTWDEQGESVTYQVGIMWADDIAHWQDPEGRWAMGVPDYVGTLEGVSEMLWELGPSWAVRVHEAWGKRRWMCYQQDVRIGAETQRYYAPFEHFGDCVGDAWLSEHGKEVVDASSE